MDLIAQLLPQEILYALGWTVVHSLWQAFIVAATASLVLLALQKHSSRVRYMVANAALLMVPVWALTTFVRLLKEGSPMAGFAEAQPFISEEVAGLGQKVNGWMMGYFEQHLPLIVTVWLMGQAFFLLKMMGGLFYVQQLKRRHVLPLEGYWQTSLEAMSAKLGLRKAIRLAESAVVKVPMVVGWLKPVILMPVGAVNNLTGGQVEAILAHELAHIFRHDYLLNILQSFIEILFYFNPAVWWISANVRSERENCCDDIAVGLCGNSLTYARALVSLQEMHHAAPAFAMPFSKSKNQLLNRIKRVLQQPQNKSNVMEKLSATLLLLAAVVILSVQANTPFGNLLDRVVSKKSQDADAALVIPTEWNVLDFQVQNDTVPGKKGKNNMFLRKHNDEEDIEITFDHDKIVSLKINGREIPKEEFGQYEDLAARMLAEVENIPEPPTPPLPPTAPAAPHIYTFPSIPSPPSPPAAPSPDGYDGRVRKITTKKEGNGTTFIIETEPGADPVRIELKDGKKGTITINGQEIKGLRKGDQTVIIERVPSEEPGFFGHNQLQKLYEGALAFPRQLEGLRIEPREFPEPSGFFLKNEGTLFAPDQDWNFLREGIERDNRLQQELQERLKDGNISKEWLEQFNGEMKQHLLAPEVLHLDEYRGRMEEEAARLREHQGQLKEEYLQQLGKIQKEQRQLLGPQVIQMEELRARMEEEAAQFRRHQEQFNREHLRQMEQIQKEQAERQLREQKMLQEKRRSSGKRLINQTGNE